MSQAFTISLEGAQRSGDVLVDAGAQAAAPSYSFSNVTANHTIAASFSIITYTITASAGANGSITPSGAVSVDCEVGRASRRAREESSAVAVSLEKKVREGAVARYTYIKAVGSAP